MSGVTDMMMALTSGDPQVHNNALQQVEQIRDNDFPSFVTYLVQELADQNAPEESRRMAGTLLKNNIALKLKDLEARDNLEARWKSLDGELRAHVKGTVLGTLECSQKWVRFTVALIIGNLARIELPVGEWPDLLESLVTGATMEGSPEFQEAALTALGYICEEANTSDELEDYLEQYSFEILKAELCGMGSNVPDVRYFAVNALNNSMEFCESNMKDGDQRNYLITSVMDTVRNSEERTQRVAMEVLVKVADLYYDFLPDFINDLFELTSQVIQGNEESVALQGILFWIAICEGERELKGNNQQTHNYAGSGSQQLVDIVFWSLTQQDDFQTEEDWNISIAAGKLLLALAECITDEIIDLVMPFVGNNIHSEDWHAREAALMAFGCILGGPKPENMYDTVASSIGGIFDYVQDQNPLVADTAGWVLAVVAELFPDVIIKNPDTLANLMNIVGPMLSGESIEMAIRAATVMQNLALYYEDDDTLPSYELSNFFQDICGGLISAMDREDGAEKLRGIAQEALNAVVDSAAQDCFESLRNIVPMIQDRLQNFINRFNDGDRTTELFLHQGLFCGTLNGVARKLGGEIGQVANGIVEQLIAIFQQSEATVQDEALLCIGALAHSMCENFIPYIGQVGDYLRIGLQNTDEFDLCNVAIGVVGDLSSSCREGFLEFASPFLEDIYNSLTKEDCHRDIKCMMLSCLGDIALNSGPGFADFLDSFMNLSDGMFQLSKSIDFSEDFEMEDYVMNLWEAICSFYTGVSQAFKENLGPFLPFLEGIRDFALYVALNGRRCEDVFSVAISLLGDLVNVINSADNETIGIARQILLIDDVYAAVQEGRNSRDQHTNKSANWTHRQIGILENINI